MAVISSSTSVGTYSAAPSSRTQQPQQTMLILLLSLLLWLGLGHQHQLLLASPYSSDAALLFAKVRPALQGTSKEDNAQLATWNSSTPLCLWRGLRWSTTPDGSPLRCHTAAARGNLSLAGDPAIVLVSIRLPAAALAGSLPPELGAFSALASLYLAANSLTGPVPLELGNAPALTVVDLSRNRLSGALPASLWNLCDNGLTDLRLHGNALTGPIPAPAGPNTTCDALRVLDLGANRLVSASGGAFPSFLAEFRGLRRLDLGANRLQGRIPEALARIPILNLSYNSFSGQLPAAFADTSESSFLGNDPSLCGPPLRHQCVSSSSGLSSRGVAAMVIGLMAAAVVLASVAIGWAQGRSDHGGQQQEEDGEGRLVVFEGGEHLTPEEVLNATGQVVENKASSYCTVYKAKLASGAQVVELRLLREGCCNKDSCLAVARRIGRARHDNLVPLRAFYQGTRGEKLLVYDHLPRARTLQDLLLLQHGATRLSWPRRHRIALGAARALAYLHAAQGEAHGNVRASAVLVDELSHVARLAEHAVDRLLLPAAAEALLHRGYRAPELHSIRRCSARTDVYAFGILLLELLMGRNPSSSSDDLPSVVKAAVLEETPLEEVLDADLLPAEDGLLQALKLAMGCCAPVPAARPTMPEVVRQLEETRPRARRSALYSPAESRSDAATPTTTTTYC